MTVARPIVARKITARRIEATQTCVGADPNATTPGQVFSGANWAWYNLNKIATLSQDSAGTTPVTAAGQPVGLVRDQSGNAYNASQSTGTARPTIVSVNSQYGLRSDFVDDYLAMPGGFTGGKAAIKTPYGHYFGSMDSASRLPLSDASEVIVADAMTTAQKTAISNHFGNTEYFYIGVNETTEVSLGFYRGGAATTVTFVGSNGVQTAKDFSIYGLETYDLADDGLTAPITVLVPKHLDFIAVALSFPTLVGCFPDLSGLNSLQGFFVGTSQHVGAIDVSSNSSLASLYCDGDQLTGFSGNIPSSVTIFDASSNLLTETVVNNLLAAFVASGTTTATIHLGGTGNAAPTGQGIIDKGILTDRGCTVITN